jgi:HPr kinase/phosphorylase
MPEPKIRRPSHITVRDFYEKHGAELQLDLIGTDVGFDRKIIEPTVNRPGLALAGFYTYFAWKRVQVVGFAELSYLKGLDEEERTRRIKELCATKIPCIVISRDCQPPKGMLEDAEAAGLSVFRSPWVTMKFINVATLLLENDFAPSTTEYGSMIDIRGIGILIRGVSGSGKSECVLGLIERGASLVADDMVRLKVIEHEVIGNPPEQGKFHLEVRGIGIINVAATFGVGSIQLAKRLDLVATLRPLDRETMKDFDRLGTDRKTFNVLGYEFPHVDIPVAPGRDVARLVEVAALNQKLRSYGHDAAVEFERSIMESVSRKKIQ